MKKTGFKKKATKTTKLSNSVIIENAYTGGQTSHFRLVISLFGDII